MNSPFDDGALSDAVSLALALSKAPSRFTDLLHGRGALPDDVVALLRLAHGASPQDVGLGESSLVSRAQLQEAARFFVEQVLLAHGADHHRVLGVKRGASHELIKEHHRLLMRLFHPDRGSLSDDWKEAFAARVNQAYNALRSGDARGADSATSARTDPVAQTAPRYAVNAPRYPARERTAVRLPPAVVQRLPQLVLGGFALIASFSVLWVYMNRQPLGAIGAAESEDEQFFSRQALPVPATSSMAPVIGHSARPKVPVSDAPVVPVPPADGWVRRPPPGDRIDARPRVTTIAAATGRAASETPASESTELRVPRVAESPVQRLPAEPANAQPAAPASRDREPVQASSAFAPQPAPPRAPAESTSARAQPEPGDNAKQESTTARPQLPVAVASSPSSETVTRTVLEPPRRSTEPGPADGMTRDELAGLIGRFLAAYALGDIEPFMALFDDGARAERGGKSKIHADYDGMFRATRTRELRLTDMQWVRNGDEFRGEGSFQARVVRKGEDAARLYQGSIKLEVGKRGNAPLIRGIFHTLAPRS